jgi:prepilin-type N-terminal cleavage/methylation domain-containing protein/prepilin-type processing-associated H-X9-DG protein
MSSAGQKVIPLWIRPFRYGFTLLELLMVVVVIAILAALLLPVLNTARAHARSTVCKNHLRQMGIALKMYADEHGSAFPYYLGPPGPSYGDEKGLRGRAIGLVYWSSKLFPYYPVSWTNQSFHCPGYKGTNTGMWPETGPLYAGTITRFGSYGYNMHGSGKIPSLGEKSFGLGPVLFWNVPPVFEGQVKTPSALLTISESRFLTANIVNIPGGTIQNGPGGGDALTCGNIRNVPFDPARHGKTYNILFCDGNVGAASPWLLFDLKHSAPMWNYDNQPHPELWEPE